MNSADYFNSQVNVPTELRTREMELLPSSIRERTHWSAAVHEAEILQLMDDVRRKEAEGQLSRMESRKELRMGLRKLGYEPEPGTEGTIKDLMSVRRQNVYLDTNIAQARGWATWNQQQAALEDFPAVQLIRLQERKLRRDWVKRWNDARAETYEDGAQEATYGWTENVGEPGPMCLANHPLLLKLSRFDLPYDPLDFNTGIRRVAVGREDAQASGILSGDVEELLEPQVRSFNEALQETPDVRESTIKQQMMDKLAGFAEWKGDVLHFTDPNGLRPVAAKDVGTLLNTPLPTGFEHLQRAALNAYLGNPESVLRMPWSNTSRDFARLLQRVESQKLAKPLEGVIPVPADQVQEFERLVQAQPMRLNVPLQLSSAPVGRAGVNVRILAATNVKDLGHATTTYRPDLKFLPAGARLEFVGREADGTILLRELGTKARAPRAKKSTPAPTPRPAPLPPPPQNPPAPPTPTAPQSAALGSTVSSAVGIMRDASGRSKATKITQAAMNETLKIIDTIHGDGPLVRTEYFTKKSKTFLGCYWSPGAGRVPAGHTTTIALNPSGKHPLMTLAHELGHKIDREGFGSDYFESETPTGPEMAEVIRLARATSSITGLGDAYNQGQLSRKDYLYYLRSREIFARCYAQYVAVESGDPNMLLELDKMQNRTGWPRHIQWQASEFAPIRAAITRLLQSKGWRQ